MLDIECRLCQSEIVLLHGTSDHESPKTACDEENLQPQRPEGLLKAANRERFKKPCAESSDLPVHMDFEAAVTSAMQINRKVGRPL
jgi:hypothetical protein